MGFALMIGAVRVVYAWRVSPGYGLSGDACCNDADVRELRTPVVLDPIPRSRCRLMAIELWDALVLLYGETAPFK